MHPQSWSCQSIKTISKIAKHFFINTARKSVFDDETIPRGCDEHVNARLVSKLFRVQTFLAMCSKPSKNIPSILPQSKKVTGIKNRSQSLIVTPQRIVRKFRLEKIKEDNADLMFPKKYVMLSSPTSD